MDSDSKQILLMLAWLFMQHGREDKALVLAAALHQAYPEDALIAGLYGRLLLGDGRPQEALSVVRNVKFPAEQERLAALLEARALDNLGKSSEGLAIWHNFLAKNQLSSSGSV